MEVGLRYLVDTEKFDKTLGEDSKKIANLIDTLKEMALVDRRAGKVPTILELERKLQQLYPRKKELENRVAALTAELNDIDGLVDRKAKLSDQQKLVSIEEELDDVKALIDKYSSEQEPLFSKQQLLSTELNNLEAHLNRVRSLKEEGLQTTEANVSAQYNEKKKKLEEVNKDIAKYDEMKNKLHEKESDLRRQEQDLQEKLTSNANYIDEDKQYNVNEKLKQCQEELTNTDVEIGNILSHPVYLASVSRISLKSYEPSALRNVIKQLVAAANKVPHMDTPEAKKETLDELEKELTSERNKSYREKKSTNVITKIIKERLDNLSFDQTELEATLQEALANLEKEQKDLAETINGVDSELHRIEEEILYRETEYKPETEQDKIKNELECKNLQEQYNIATEIEASYLDKLELLKAEIKTLSDVVGVMSNLKLLDNDNFRERLNANLEECENVSIPSLVKKSAIDEKVEALMNEVMGIKHRKLFNASPREVQEKIEKLLEKLENTREQDMENFFAPQEEPQVEAEEPVELDEIPVIDLNLTDDEVRDAIDAIKKDNNEIVKENLDVVKEDNNKNKKDDYGFDVTEPAFAAPVVDVPSEEPIEVPSFNPLDATRPQPVVSEEVTASNIEEGPIKVISMEPVDTKTSEKDHQASFEDVIPKEVVATETPDFAELDRVLNGNDESLSMKR